MRAFRRTTGQTTTEYLGVLLIVALIVAAIAQTDLSDRLRAETARTICRTLNAAEDCPPPYSEQRRRSKSRARGGSVASAASVTAQDPERRARELEHGDRRIFDARDRPRLRSRLARRPGDGPSKHKEANRVFSNLGRIYDYWLDTFGRDSYDGRGSPLIATVDYRQFPDEPFPQAYWDPRKKQLVFGEGYGRALDVTAHEVAHGVILSEVGLGHEGENGALGEAIADMFASNLDRNWTVGENLPGGALRDMARPGRIKYRGRITPPAHTRDYVKAGPDLDQGGIHINAGIPNRAYVNMVGSIGRDAAQRVLYGALTTHLKRGAGFEDFRTACLKATADGFGQDSPEYRDVNRSFAKVGLDGTWKPPR